MKNHSRAWIRYQRDRWIQKRLRQARMAGWMDLQPKYSSNWYYKRDICDCGHTACMTCHGYKLLRIPKPADIRQLEGSLI